MGTFKISFKHTILLLLLFFAFSCSKDDTSTPTPKEVVKSSTKQITSFAFLLSNNPIDENISASIDEANKTITATMPVGTDITSLLPEIKTSALATVNNTVAIDFTNPVKFTVTAEDGSNAEYTVSIKVPSTQKDALQALIDDNPANTLDWDLANTEDSNLGSLEGVETDPDGNIITLFINFKNLSELSPEIVLLSHLELFVLDGNPFTSLPPEFWQLTTLTEISLISTELTSIPSEIGLLTNLEIIRIEDNPLTSIPPEIGLLLNLRRFDLERNQITSLPPEMGFLLNLETLFLDESNVETIPSSLFILFSLNNIITSGLLPPPSNVSSQIDALISIYSANPGNTLEWGVNNFPEVTFDANGNPTVISMNNKNLTRLPNNIDQLENLETLNMNGNNLQNLPVSIGNLSSLGVLALAGNNLGTVPSELGQLSNLALLSLTNNPITDIPQGVCNLQTSNGGILTILTDPGEGCN